MSIINKVLLLIFWYSFAATGIALCVAVLGDIFDRESLSKYAYAVCFSSVIFMFIIALIGLSANIL